VRPSEQATTAKYLDHGTVARSHRVTVQVAVGLFEASRPLRHLGGPPTRHLTKAPVRAGQVDVTIRATRSGSPVKRCSAGLRSCSRPNRPAGRLVEPGCASPDITLCRCHPFSPSRIRRNDGVRRASFHDAISLPHSSQSTLPDTR
jgi:hypothetical protein